MSQPVSIRGAQLRRNGEDLEIPHVLLDSVPKWRNEQAFAEGVVHLAQNCGWLACHFRPARTKARNGQETYRTAIVGNAGWPDIVAVHPGTGRMVLAELKMKPVTQQQGRPSADQQRWLDALDGMAWKAGVWELSGGDGYERTGDIVIVRVWRPEDYDREIVPTFTGVWS